MRRIDIFVSSPADVQKERSVVERLIRSIAAEFNVPVTVSYSNRLRSLPTSDKVVARSANGYDDGRSLLCPCFWEYKDFKLEPDYQERIPNTGQYDLVISILWSRLGTKISPAFVMPDGSQPTSATEYEIAWALDQMKRTPGFPELHVYRNRSTPVAPLEPRKEREASLQQWDSVQEFFSTWRINSAFQKACSEYSDLSEFEALFRKHFREFVAKQLDREIVPRKPAPHTQYWQLNPYRGLQFFNFEHAAIFYGRTKAIGEVLEILKKQANAKCPFILIIGPSGSGKSSLVRAGLLPFLTEVGSTTGPWRRAIARPGAGGEAEDPFRRLAGALLEETALPELEADHAGPYARQNLAADLCENPHGVVLRITELLDELGKQELERLAGEVQDEHGLPDRIESTELARHRRLTRIKPKAHLALLVDSLEELFTADLSAELQHRYLTALVALIRSQRVFVIATLQSECYAAYQQFPELIELAGSGGRYDLQPPTSEEIGDMIRLPAEAAGLRFEQDITTGYGLDKTILDAAVSSAEPLPLLEHLLSELYQRQAARKDNLLRQSDYLEVGKFEGALGNHAETLFATLNSDAQGAFDLVMRRLVSFGHGDQGIRRTVPYRDLVSTEELDNRQKEGAKDLVDTFIKEGLFYAEPDLKAERIVCISHQALLRRWPRVRQWLAEDQAFLRMRDRLDASLNLWLRRDRQCEDLLGPAFGVSDAETLLRHFRSSLSKTQIEYIEKILATQRHDRRLRDGIWWAMAAGLMILAGVAGIQWYNLDSQRKGAEELARIERRIVEFARERRSGQENEAKRLTENTQGPANPDLTSSGSRAMQVQLKEALDKAQAAQQSADLAIAQRIALETQLKQAQDKAQAAQQNTDLATAQRGALETQLKQAQAAQKNADLVASQRTALETQLKESQDKAQAAQKNADLAASQRTALETQLKESQDKAQAAQKNADLATSQRTVLETQLKESQDKAQIAQKNADLAIAQRSAVESQLKQAQDKAQAAQQNVDLATSQRMAALESQLKQAQDKAQAAQQGADLATAQRTALDTQLKQAQDKAQAAQQSADRVTSEHSAMEAEIKQLEDRVQLAEQKAELAISQRGAMEAQMKMAEARAKLAQQNADLAASQRSAMEEELKKSEERAQLAQKNADLVVEQRTTLEARSDKATGQPETLQQQNGQTNQSVPKVNSTPTDAPISADPDQTKQNRNENQPGETQSNLVVATSPEPSPADSPADGNTKSETDEQQLKSFVLDYLRTIASNDVSTQERFFAHRVTYYGQGVLSLRRVQAAKESYDSQWPTRDWKPQGDSEIRGTSNPRMYEILQPYAWTVSDGSRNDQGTANLFLRIWKNTKGEFHIVHIEQRDR